VSIVDQDQILQDDLEHKQLNKKKDNVAKENEEMDKMNFKLPLNTAKKPVETVEDLLSMKSMGKAKAIKKAHALLPMQEKRETNSIAKICKSV